MDIKQINISDLPHLPLAEYKSLPNIGGLYFVTSNGRLDYIGATVNFCQRWKVHHRMKQFKSLACVEIAWLEIQNTENLKKLEKQATLFFKPNFYKQRMPQICFTPQNDGIGVSTREEEALKIIEKGEVNAKQIGLQTSIPPGTLYKTLYTLVAKDIIQGRSQAREIGAPLVFYSLTDRGKRVLKGLSLLENGE